MGEADKNYLALKEHLTREGPFLSVAGNIEEIQRHFLLSPSPSIKALRYAISIGYPLSAPVIEEIVDHPTILYKHHYRQVNNLLDRVALSVHGFILNRGGASLPIPTSVFLDRKTQAAHLSHKMVANHLGLGWIGQNILLITSETGARIRLVTVLTDFPLESPQRPGGSCGDCVSCARVCPAEAIGDKPEDFNLEACSKICQGFGKKYVGVSICGICVKACSPGLGETG